MSIIECLPVPKSESQAPSLRLGRHCSAIYEIKILMQVNPGTEIPETANLSRAAHGVYQKPCLSYMGFCESGRISTTCMFCQVGAVALK